MVLQQGSNRPWQYWRYRSWEFVGCCISINTGDVWDWLSFVDISRPCPIGKDRFVSLIQGKRSSVRPGDGKDFPSETGSAPSILHNKVRGKNPEELWWRVKNHEDHEEPSISKSHKVTPFEATSHCVCAWLDPAGPTWPGSRSHFSGRSGVTMQWYWGYWGLAGCFNTYQAKGDLENNNDNSGNNNNNNHLPAFACPHNMHRS